MHHIGKWIERSTNQINTSSDANQRCKNKHPWTWTDLKLNGVIANDESNVQLRAIRGEVLCHAVRLQDVDAVARVSRAQEDGHIELGVRGKGSTGGGKEYVVWH